MSLLFLLALIGFNAFPPIAVTLKIDQSDKYERRFIDNESYPHEFYASFVTVYKINNRVVKTDEFWGQKLRGRNIQVKAVPKNGFWFATRLNLLDDSR